MKSISICLYVFVLIFTLITSNFSDAKVTTKIVVRRSEGNTIGELYLTWPDPDAGTSNSYDIDKKFGSGSWTDFGSTTDPTHEIIIAQTTLSVVGTDGPEVAYVYENVKNYLEASAAGVYRVKTDCGFDEQITISGGGCEECCECPTCGGTSDSSSSSGSGGCSTCGGSGGRGGAGGAPSAAIGTYTPFTISYHSGETAYLTELNYGWGHNWDKRLILLGTSGDGKQYEAYLGGRRLRFLEDGGGSYHAYNGSDIVFTETNEGGTDYLRIWDKKTNRAYKFRIPASSGWSSAYKIIWEMKVMSQDANGAPLGYYISYKYTTADTGRLEYLVDGSDSSQYSTKGLLKFEYDGSNRLEYVKDPKQNPAGEIAHLYYDANSPYMLNEFKTWGTNSTKYYYHGTYTKKLTEKRKYLDDSNYEKVTWDIDYVDQKTINGNADDLVIYKEHKAGTSNDQRKLMSMNPTWSNDIIVPESTYYLIKEAWKSDGQGGVISRQRREYLPYYEESGSELYEVRKTEYLEADDEESPAVLKTVISKYDSNGNLVQTQIQGPSSYYLTTGYKYDEHDSVTKVMTRKSQTLDWVNDTPDATYSYTYEEGTDHKTKEVMIDGYGVWHVTEYIQDNSHAQDRVYKTYVEFSGVKAQETTYAYYSSGDTDRKFMLEKITDPKGKETSYDYNSDHTIKSVTDTKGRVTTYTYDYSESNSYGQPWKITSQGPHGNLVTEYEYNDLGQTTKVTNPPSVVGGTSFITEFTYDRKGRQTTQTQKYGATVLSTTTNVYDSDSGLLEEVKRDPGTVGGTVYVIAKYDYDYSGAVTKTNNAAGDGTTGGDSEVVYEYDDLAQKIKDSYKKATDDYIDMQYEYWSDGSLKKTTDERTVDIQYTYNTKNLLDTIDYESDADTAFTYNTQRDVTQISRDSRSVSYTYDTRGRLTKITDPWGMVIENKEFDEDTLAVTEMRYPGHTSNIEYTYNDYGQLTEILDTYNGNKETDYNYNPWTDAIERIDLPNGSHAVYTYDNIGRLTKLRNYKSNDQTINQFEYSYKNTCACTSGVIDRITFEDGRYVEYDYTDLEWLNKEDYKNAQGTSYTRHDFEYDECDGNRLTMQFDGQEDQMTYWSDNINADEDTEPENFGASNQLQRIWTDTTVETAKTAGHKVSVGGRYSETNPLKVEVTPGYYDSGDVWGTTVEAQTLRDGLFIARGVQPSDRSDNKFKVVVTDKAGNASSAATITGVDFDVEAKEKFWYDAMGSISKRERTFTYDNEQDPVVETTRYFYDDANRLLYVDLPSGDDQYYIYGPLGDRISIEYGTVTLSGENFSSFSATSAKTRKFVNLDGNIIQEYDNNNPTPNLEFEYIRGIGLGGGIGSILYQKDVSDGVNTYWRYYHYNHKGDVYALSDHPADSNDVEELMALYEYDAWGRTTVQALKANVNNEFRFSTKPHDKDSGLVYFRARYYDPVITRWIKIDPIWAFNGLNIYLYVGNQPATFIDIFGTQQANPDEREVIGGSRAGHCIAYWRCYQAWRDANNAATSGGGSVGQINGPADAIRHCVYGCSLQLRCPEGFAGKMAEAHETGARNADPNDPEWREQAEMDIYNTNYGILLAQNKEATTAQECIKKCKEAMRGDKLKILAYSKWISVPNNRD